MWVLDCPLRLRTVSVTTSSAVSLGAIDCALAGQRRRLAKVQGGRPTVYTNHSVATRNTSCPLTHNITRPLTCLEELLVVGILAEDAGAVVAAVQRVVDQAIGDQSRGSAHAGTLIPRQSAGKEK